MNLIKGADVTGSVLQHVHHTRLLTNQPEATRAERAERAEREQPAPRVIYAPQGRTPRPVCTSGTDAAPRGYFREPGSADRSLPTGDGAHRPIRGSRLHGASWRILRSGPDRWIPFYF